MRAMSDSPTEVVRVTRAGGGCDDDTIAVEEPLEIRVGEKPLSVTMRTPGDDTDLAAGFLLTEGIVGSFDDIAEIRHWGSPNVIRAALRDGVSVDWQRLQRHFYSSSSCGVCGKTSIDAIRVQAQPLSSAARVQANVVRALPEALRARQRTFDATGAIHAAGAFAADGTPIAVREDVGRHNAVDKVVGALARSGQQADILVVSGRASFEIIQKAVLARIPIVAAVGAPSSLAVQLAREMNQTLFGFVRDGRFNVYAGESRLVLAQLLDDDVRPPAGV